MKSDFSLSHDQQQLVEEHIHLVKWVIFESISLNENMIGLGYEDVFQEGCIYLCYAAASYIADRAKFDTYAKKVIRNGLISYCRRIGREQLHISNLSVDEHGNLLSQESCQMYDDEFQARITTFEILEVLSQQKQKMDGIARLGVESLALKVCGNSLSEISHLYLVPANHVGAWISRAISILRKDKSFIEQLQK